MRIADVRTHVLEAPLTEPFHWSFNGTRTRGACIVEIVADDGTVGWGECFGPAPLNAAIVNAYAARLVGRDALATDAIWEDLYGAYRDQGQKGLAISALSGVDIALWDLKGKHFGVPAYRLMGGPLRTQVRAYATGTYRVEQGDPFEYVVDEVAGYAEQGFHAAKVKIGFDVDADAALVRAVRRKVGPDFGLMVDANHGFDAIEAIAFGRAVADLDIGWFEEPVIPEDLASYREVRRGQPVPGGGRRVRVHALGIPRDLHDARDGHRAARHVRGRRAVRVQEDRRHGGGVRRPLRAARVGNRRGARRVAAASRGAAAFAAAPHAAGAHPRVRPVGASVPAGRAHAPDRARPRHRAHSRRTGTGDRRRPRGARAVSGAGR